MSPLHLAVAGSLCLLTGAVVGQKYRRTGDTAAYVGLAAWLAAYLWWLFG